MNLLTTVRAAFKNKSAPGPGGPAATPPAPRPATEPEHLLRFEIREPVLCAELKVSKDELRRRRLVLLVQGAHWDYINKRVLLNGLGAEILRKTAHSALWASYDAARAAERATADSAAKRVPIAFLPEKNPPPVEFTGELVAWTSPKHNSRLVIAYLPGTDPGNPLNLVTLLVRSNLNFLRGMTIPGPGRQVKQLDPQRYELLGEPPRWRGRW